MLGAIGGVCPNVVGSVADRELRQYLVAAILRPGNVPAPTGEQGTLRRLIPRLSGAAFPLPPSCAQTRSMAATRPLLVVKCGTAIRNGPRRSGTQNVVCRRRDQARVTPETSHVWKASGAVSSGVQHSTSYVLTARGL